MEILGNSYQEKEPIPTEPVEIKDNIIIVKINNEQIEIPLKIKPIEKIFKKDEEWAITCPVCYGRGFVSAGFYESTGFTWVSTITGNETCRSCSGKGYIKL